MARDTLLETTLPEGNWRVRILGPNDSQSDLFAEFSRGDERHSVRFAYADDARTIEFRPGLPDGAMGIYLHGACWVVFRAGPRRRRRRAYAHLARQGPFSDHEIAGICDKRRYRQASARRKLIERFRAAWDGVSEPINITGPCQCGECIEIALYFRGTTPYEHTVERLAYHGAALSFFTPEAFHYFLPAFMIAEIEDPEEANGDSIVFHFSRKQPDHNFSQRLRRFDDEQRECIIQFLRMYGERYEMFGDKDIAHAIQNLGGDPLVTEPELPPAAPKQRRPRRQSSRTKRDRIRYEGDSATDDS